MTTIPVNVTLPVTLIPCVAPIRANAGDKLMMVNGVCIGRYDEQVPQPTAPIKHLNGKDTFPADDRLLAACSDVPQTAMRVGDKLGLPRDASRERAYVGYHLRKLAAEGALKQVDGPNGPSRVPCFVVAG
jgi:hypothetical protein